MSSWRGQRNKEPVEMLQALFQASVCITLDNMHVADRRDMSRQVTRQEQEAQQRFGEMAWVEEWVKGRDHQSHQTTTEPCVSGKGARRGKCQRLPKRKGAPSPGQGQPPQEAAPLTDPGGVQSQLPPDVEDNRSPLLGSLARGPLELPLATHRVSDAFPAECSLPECSWPDPASVPW